MAVQHFGAPGQKQEIERLWREIKRVAKATMQNGAIGNAGLRVYDGGWITIENGGLDVEGTASVSGLLTGNGTFDWWGPWFMRGNGQIIGSVAISGAVTLNSTLTVSSGQIRAGDVTVTPTGGGRVQVGAMQIDGASTGTIRSSGAVTVEGGGSTSLRVVGRTTTSDLLVFGDITAETLSVSGPKSFRMPHPSKDNTWLRHGSTESPVSGIEYWGEGVLNASGEDVIYLPDYFESLAKPGGRSVFVAGRGFAADWTDIEDGRFSVTGDPGRKFSWLVKAERFGGDFLVEEPVDADSEPEDQEES